MPTNEVLNHAKREKRNEFYTQYEDIEKEIQIGLKYTPKLFQGKTVLLPCNDYQKNIERYFKDNFDTFELKMLVSVEYKDDYDVAHAYIKTRDNETTVELKENGDFRSEEVTEFRDKADVIVTNPPFSLFRVFMDWIKEALSRKPNLKFSVMGTLNAVTYKNVFPLIQNNQCWFGNSITKGDRAFEVSDSYSVTTANTSLNDKGKELIRVTGVRWYTNIDHAFRHTPKVLHSLEECLQTKKHSNLADKFYMQKYDNLDAFEIPFMDVIPNNVSYVLGVPVTFIDSFCPEQFEIVGATNSPKIQNTNIYKRVLVKLNNVN